MLQRRERELDLWFYFISAKVTEQPEDWQPAQHPQSLPGGEPHGNHRPCTGGRSHCSQNRHSLGWRMDSGTRPAVSAAPGNSMTLPPFTLYRSKPSAWCQPLCLSSVQFSLSVVADTLWPNGLQHTRLPCLSPTPGDYVNSWPSSRRCHPTISSSVIPFPSHLRSFSAAGSFQISQFFASRGQSIEVSASSFQWILRADFL